MHFFLAQVSNCSESFWEPHLEELRHNPDKRIQKAFKVFQSPLLTFVFGTIGFKVPKSGFPKPSFFDKSSGDPWLFSFPTAFWRFLKVFGFLKAFGLKVESLVLCLSSSGRVDPWPVLLEMELSIRTSKLTERLFFSVTLGIDLAAETKSLQSCSKDRRQGRSSGFSGQWRFLRCAQSNCWWLILLVVVILIPSVFSWAFASH